MIFGKSFKINYYEDRKFIYDNLAKLFRNQTEMMKSIGVLTEIVTALRKRIDVLETIAVKTGDFAENSSKKIIELYDITNNHEAHIAQLEGIEIKSKPTTIN